MTARVAAFENEKGCAKILRLKPPQQHGGLEVFEAHADEVGAEPLNPAPCAEEGLLHQYRDLTVRTLCLRT
jgi:hypothetical protein